MDAVELAARLVSSSKSVTPDRIDKVTKHLVSRAHYQAFLQALPEDVRAIVDVQLAAQVDRKFS